MDFFHKLYIVFVNSVVFKYLNFGIVKFIFLMKIKFLGKGIIDSINKMYYEKTLVGWVKYYINIGGKSGEWFDSGIKKNM